MGMHWRENGQCHTLVVEDRGRSTMLLFWACQVNEPSLTNVNSCLLLPDRGQHKRLG